MGGVFLLFAAWAIQRDSGNGPFEDVGTVATAIIGILTIAFAFGAAFAAREEWLGRPLGRMLGLVVAVVALLAAVVTLLIGKLNGTEPLFYIGAGLGLLTAIPLLVPDSRTSATG